MKAKILAKFLLEFPEHEVLKMVGLGWKGVKPSVSTALYSDIVDCEEKIIVKEYEDFILIEGVEL